MGEERISKKVFIWGNGRRKEMCKAKLRMDTGKGRHEEYAHWKIVSKVNNFENCK